MKGSVWNNPRVERSGKNAVSCLEFGEEYFPSFCAGLTYFLTVKAVKNLVRAKLSSDEKTFLWLDDVFITGILSEKSKVPLLDIGVCTYIEKQYQFERLQMFQNLYTTDIMLTASSRQHFSEHLIYGPGNWESLKR